MRYGIKWGLPEACEPTSLDGHMELNPVTSVNIFPLAVLTGNSRSEGVKPSAILLQKEWRQNNHFPSLNGWATVSLFKRPLYGGDFYTAGFNLTFKCGNSNTS